jgi:hypothetical protein
VANNSDFISRYRSHTTTFLHALDALMAARRQWDALDLGNTLTEEDFAGANADVTVAELTAAVSSVEAINGFVATGHATNLYELLV